MGFGYWRAKNTIDIHCLVRFSSVYKRFGREYANSSVLLSGIAVIFTYFNFKFG